MSYLEEMKNDIITCNRSRGFFLFKLLQSFQATMKDNKMGMILILLF